MRCREDCKFGLRTSQWTCCCSCHIKWRTRVTGDVASPFCFFSLIALHVQAHDVLFLQLRSSFRVPCVRGLSPVSSWLRGHLRKTLFFFRASSAQSQKTCYVSRVCVALSNALCCVVVSSLSCLGLLSSVDLRLVLSCVVMCLWRCLVLSCLRVRTTSPSRVPARLYTELGIERKRKAMLQQRAEHICDESRRCWMQGHVRRMI